MYTETYETSVKKIKDLNKWRDIPCSWIGKLYIVKIAIFLIKHSTIPIKIPAVCFVDSKIHVELQGTSNKVILKKNKVGGFTSQIQNLAIAIKL